MLVTYRYLWQLLSKRERRYALTLFAMIIVMGLLQMVGVASVMPFMSVVANPEVISSNKYLSAAYSSLGFKDRRLFLLALGAVVFMVVMVSIGVKALTTYASARFGEMRKYSLSRKLMAGYLCQPYEFFLCRHSADLGKTILSETEAVISNSLNPAVNLISEGVIVIAVATLLVVADPVLAASISIGIGGAYTIIYWALRRRLGHIGQDQVRANRERFQAVQETFGSIKDVKFGNLEGPLLLRYDRPARRFARAQAGLAIASQMPRFALEALAFGGLLLIVISLLARSSGLREALPLLAVYAFGAYRLMPALQSVYSQLVALRFSAPALHNLYHELNRVSVDASTELPLERPLPLSVREGIRLDNVTYTYPSGVRPAIRDLSLSIPVRSTIGLIGKTGSGKTTAVDLLLGLLRPQYGSVMVDGEAVTTSNMRRWQATVGYVSQQIYLADATISENIALGVPAERINPVAVERAARIANLHDFVVQELPQGYDTAVGERGVRLSGGQRQRVGIARALYFDPEVLVFDEATSALDNVTEQAVMNAVTNLGRRKTIILIAHRLSTVRCCDRIYLMENGRLEAEGTYESLSDSNATFRQMALTAPDA